MKEYQAYRLWCQGADKEGKPLNNIGDLNRLLADGWVPVRESPGHAGGDWRIVTWLLILEREKPNKPVVVQPKRPDLVALLQGVIERAKDRELNEDDFLAELKKL